MSRASRRRQFRRISQPAGAALTIALLCLATTVSATSAAATTAPTTDVITESVNPLTLTVTPDQPVFSADANDFTFIATLENDGETAVAPAMLALSVNTTAVTSVAALSENSPAQNSQLVSLTKTEEIGAGETTEISVTLPKEQFPFTAETARGVYLLSAELLPPRTEPLAVYADPLATSAHTPFTWQGLNTDQNVPVTFVMPLVLPAHITVMPTQAQLAAETPRLRAQLKAAQTAQATLAVDPRIVTGIRAYGDLAPSSAQDFLTELLATDLPVFLLQYSDADPSAQANLGATSLLAPTGFDFILRNGLFQTSTEDAPDQSGSASDTPSDTDTDTEPPADTEPSSQDTPDRSDENRAAERSASENLSEPAASEPQLPSMQELSEFPQAYLGAWPAPGQIDQATLQLLRSAELTSLVVDATNVPGATNSRVTFDGFSALVADTELTAHTAAWANADEGIERTRAEAQIVAELTLHGLTQDHGVVIAIDRAVAANSADLPQLIEMIGDQTGVTFTNERNLTATPAQFHSASPLEPRIEALRALNATSAQISELAPLLRNPKYLIEYQQLRLLNAYATAYADPAVDFTRVSEKITERDDDLLQGVQAVSTATTHLIGASSDVPITLHNHLPFDALVSVHAKPGSAAIEVPEQKSQLIEVPARGNAVHLVRVESRVSSGEAPLLIEVLDEFSTQSYATLDMQLRLRTAYETVLLSVLGISAVLLLGGGIWRSIRRRRPTTETVQAATEEDTDSFLRTQRE